MTFRLRRTPRPRPTLNLSPLIDVIFILLIFVVLVARFVDQERLDVKLPSADAARPAEIDALLITVTEDGSVVLEGEVVETDALLDRLRADRERHARAVLVADGSVDLQSAVDVISTAKLAGFDAVAVATRPPDP